MKYLIVGQDILLTYYSRILQALALLQVMLTLNL